jgi:hypothetical protein
MRSTIIYIMFMAVVVIVLGCTAAIDSRDAEPARPGGPVFDHKAHIDRGPECSDCHGEKDGEWKAMPDRDSCMQCHEDLDKDDQPVEKWAKNFFDDKDQGLWIHAGKQSAEIIFPHAAHVEAAADCNACHKSVAEGSFIPKSAFIDMKTCMTCHAQKAPDKNDCATCHKEIRRDNPPKSHHLGWRREHGRGIRMSEFDAFGSDCALCHKKNECDECHRAEAPMNHTNLWRMQGHAAMASMERDSCEVCHKSDSCNECHEVSKPRNHRPTFGEPFNRHCVTCHLPDTGFDNQGCAVCHHGAPSHDLAPIRPGNPVHATATVAQCRECHSNPLPHPDNGDSCIACHR